MNNMRNKILSLLVLLLTAATGAWAEDLSNKIWKPGDTFNIGQAWFYCDDRPSNWVFYHATGADNVVPAIENWSYSSDYEQWGIITSFINVDKRDNNGNESVTTNPVNLWITPPEGKKSADYQPVGFKILSGDGSKTSPYKFELVYELPLTVTINDAKDEASFQMPAFDATAEYELVRDMSVQMKAQVGDGTQEQPRYRVKKDGNNKFIPADMEMAAVPALFTVNDAIEQKALTPQDYIVQIYAIDAEGQPTGEAMTFATFTFEPGIYAVKAVAATGSDYDGETALSNTFKLFQGYEITVPAGEFATYYKDENIYEEEDDAELYTIQSVSADQVTLSNVRDLVPANTAMLVYNKGQETKTFLLIPTEDEPVSFMSYMHFIGTLEATTIAASTESQTNYALNGKAFVFVKDAIAVDANRAWLEIPSQQSNVKTLRIIFGGDATSIHNAQFTIHNDEWYDLNGRKLNGMPTKKGIYVKNGKKVVVK